MLVSPMSKVTPSQYLRIGSFPDMQTPNLMRSESFQLQQFIVPAPKGFSLETAVIQPNKSHLNASAFNESLNAL